MRVIAATNRDLAEEVRKGRFREDLFYRLNVFPIRMPPLRERPADIPLLVWAFLEDLSSRVGKKITQVPRAAMEALQRHSWPGNVRELRNVIEHAVIITTGDTLRMPAPGDAAPAAPSPQTLADAEREHILRAVESTGWRIKGPKGAATVLGLNPATLYSRMKKLGIRPGRQEAGPHALSRRACRSPGGAEPVYPEGMSSVERERDGTGTPGLDLTFETLIAELSSRFINLPPGDVDHEIDDALRSVCQLLGIDLAVLWQWMGVPPVLRATHFHYAEAGLEPPEPLRREQFPWYHEQMVAGRVVCWSSLEDLPAEAAVDREACILFGVKSNLCVPLALTGEPPVGVLGYSTLRAERHWPTELVQRLQLVAQVFTNALARRRADEVLRRSEARYAAAADLDGLGYYDVAFDEAYCLRRRPLPRALWPPGRPA